jgi:signal transduction histidine kinase
MTTIRDMSHWVELERQRNITRLKTIAFSQAAHEFRNPLNGIVLSLNLLENLYDKERGEEYFLTAKNCAQLMLFLVRDIMDLSQLEMKSFIINYSEINIDEVIEKCLSMFTQKASQKNINLYFTR